MLLRQRFRMSAGVLRAFLGLMISLVSVRDAFGQAGAVQRARPNSFEIAGSRSPVIASPTAAINFDGFDTRSTTFACRSALAQVRPSADANCEDAAPRQAHVGRDMLIGAGLGVALGIYRYAQEASRCGVSCSGGPEQLHLFRYGLEYGLIGGAAGGIVAWLWSKH